MKRFLGRRCAPNIEPYVVKDYFWVSRDTAGTFNLSGSSSKMDYLYYSFDGKSWVPVDRINVSINRYIYLEADQKIYFRGKGTATYINYNTHLHFQSISKAGGNIMSLLYDEDFEDETEVGSYAFASLFHASSNLADVNDLKLPAVTVGSYAYNNMFCGSIITSAPELPATILGEYCYGDMFMNCHNLIEIPYLPATTLAKRCYYRMFEGCRGLRDLRQLPATTLAEGCYYEMFYGTHITHIPYNLLPATTLAKECYAFMFSNIQTLETIPQDLLPATVMDEACYAGMFYKCQKLNYIPSKLLSNVVTMAYECFGRENTGTSEWYRGMFENCISLTYIPQNLLPCTTLAQRCYCRMFAQCTGLTTIPSNLLPATTLAEECYRSMFTNCTGLTYIPENLLQATTLAPYCYRSMFYCCNGLTTIPASLLPARRLSKGCYYNMFSECDGLVSIPVGLLPATLLAEECYYGMFSGCNLLTDIGSPLIPVNATYAKSCCGSMFSACIGLQQVDLNLLPSENIADSCYRTMFANCYSLQNTPTFNFETTAENCCLGMFDHCTSLTDIEKLKPKVLASSCYDIMFRKCTSLTEINEDLLAAETMAATSCYGMFWDCTSLTSTPKFKFTTTASACCQYMFMGCTSLTKSEKLLPETTLFSHCYRSMYQGCTSLTDVGDIEGANYTGQSCCQDMFNGCTALVTAPKVNPKGSTVYTDACLQMFQGCTSLSDIIKVNLEATNLYGGAYKNMFDGCISLNIPRGWTIAATTHQDYASTSTTSQSGCCAYMFKGCSSLTRIPILKARNIHHQCYEGMFQDCTGLVDITINNNTEDASLDATSVKRYSYRYMFQGCTSLQNVPADLIKGTTFYDGACYQMFEKCRSLSIAPYILEFTTVSIDRNTAGMAFLGMFQNCYNTVEINDVTTYTGLTRMAKRPGETVASIKPMTNNSTLHHSTCAYMFGDCKALTELPHIYPINMAGSAAFMGIFQGCDSITSVPGDLFEVPNSIKQGSSPGYYWADGMFNDCKGLTTINTGLFDNQPLRRSCYASMFEGCTGLTDGVAQDLIPEENIDTDGYGCYKAMFKNCTNLTVAPDLLATDFSESDCRAYEEMFMGCSSLTTVPNIGFNTGETVGVGLFPGYSMFRDCINLETIPFTLKGRFDGSYMFYNCQALQSVTLDITNDRDEEKGITYGNLESMFQRCVGLLHVYGSILVTCGTEAAQKMFQGCSELISVSNVTILGGGGIGTNRTTCMDMFQGCSKLQSVGGIIKPSVLVPSMFEQMFMGCKNITTVPTFDIKTNNNEGVSAFYRCFFNMFRECEKLTSVTGVIKIDTLPESAMCDMFQDCKLLTTIPNISIKTTTINSKSAFYGMFEGCAALTAIPKSLFSHNTVADYMYNRMFWGCSALGTIPNNESKDNYILKDGDLPAKTLMNNCYSYMFYGTHITEVEDGAIDAETLSDSCCRGMFWGCTSLTKASTPPAKNAIQYCYLDMFRGCTNLAEITCLLESRASEDTTTWVYNVATNGTFYKKRGVNWLINSSGIPSGWTVIEVD